MKFKLLPVLIVCMAFAGSTFAQKSILITNVQIFNGRDNQISPGNVLITGNQITRISDKPIPVNKSTNTSIIDGKGKFLMPGLIDAHAHTLMDAIPLQVGLTSDIGYLNLFAAASAEKQLLRGFTSVRDVGGPSFSLKRAIDEGLVKGPRIYPSGATVSQTGGHGDFGGYTDVPRVPGQLSYLERSGLTIIADGADQVLMRTRELLRQGATQIKVMAGGGVASNYDPLDVNQYTEAEIKAAVSAATAWNTYVTVHAYTPTAMQAAIQAGVKCIEHGQLADEATAKLMAEKGIWWSLQPFLDDEDAIPFPEGSDARKKQLTMVQGTDNAYALAKKYNIKTAFGTDCLFDPKLAARQGAQLAKMVRWYTPFEVLRMATSNNAELLALSGPRNPYPLKLGVIEEGAYADLILVDGNPLENIQLVADPDKKFLLIMKDGIIYKNTLK
ncbi:amidohydrolase family protein [Flavihumibacter cheonanensis]|uniref:metal-dependent hydrolase family protein n=1 Tax=Flavihumibacter cheonanensis TaxID=1442385 RepID=UPI001EF9438E|nr:amidohydrolase family protein [Flavihumibacter cheonanensis]MCG7751710.1 amidohydrolase family protein [Flavihumibacter cheonanensis]